jgi:hypothetical protein
MSEPSFPKPVAEVVAMLADICRHQRRNEILEILDNSHASLDNIKNDNGNGSTFAWELRLAVPVHLFASAELRLPRIEKEIVDKLKYIRRVCPNHIIKEATILPAEPEENITSHRFALSGIDERRLWPNLGFRLFLSHVSKFKAEVAELEDALAMRGVAAFVAHEAIKPSLEWQKEIELALRSMDALAALITPDFHESDWTDQEIGWAFGRGLLVLPVRLGCDPYGFAGKVQGVAGTFENPERLSALIVESLLTNQQTHGEMRRALVTAFCKASSTRMAQALQTHILEVTDFTDDDKAALIRACKENDIVAEAFSVNDSIYEKFGKPSNPDLVREDHDDVPF